MTDDSSEKNVRRSSVLTKAEQLTRDVLELMLFEQIPSYLEILENGAWFFKPPSELNEWTHFDDGTFFNIPLELLASLGYFIRKDADRASIKYQYHPTDKAWSLLDRPRETPNIFISYKRGVSSALALLIESRLREGGANPQNIFIDKDILGGENWERLLKFKVNNCDYFVCLIGKYWEQITDNNGNIMFHKATSLDSPYVRDEIEWAFASPRDCRIIPVYHNGYTARECEADYPDLGKKLNTSNARELVDEKASDYEEAVNFVLRSLDYRT